MIAWILLRRKFSLDKSEEIFKKIIGYENSLKAPIELVKTTVFYPDNGFTAFQKEAKSF
ncbi:hypothetical protein J27TS8_36440 [Robertmurraya siralis]|uniref:Uncharacterized protein n=1 Tax=Robertmurraya siralis TaxID=77777 RepID=A0A920BVL6_9BACI|nr:hypothetical protein J27TS8_36440 [Robertmurraya siralis]